jgi:hypothetical protein
VTWYDGFRCFLRQITYYARESVGYYGRVHGIPHGICRFSIKWYSEVVLPTVKFIVFNEIGFYGIWIVEGVRCWK